MHSDRSRPRIASRFCVRLTSNQSILSWKYVNSNSWSIVIAWFKTSNCYLSSPFRHSANSNTTSLNKILEVPSFNHPHIDSTYIRQSSCMLSTWPARHRRSFMALPTDDAQPCISAAWGKSNVIVPEPLMLWLVNLRVANANRYIALNRLRFGDLRSASRKPYLKQGKIFLI